MLRPCTFGVCDAPPPGIVDEESRSSNLVQRRPGVRYRGSVPSWRCLAADSQPAHAPKALPTLGAAARFIAPISVGASGANLVTPTPPIGTGIVSAIIAKPVCSPRDRPPVNPIRRADVGRWTASRPHPGAADSRYGVDDRHVEDITKATSMAKSSVAESDPTCCVLI
jgi:hypothetical protein